MKKRKIFLMATLTALAMASCSSFEEPAALNSDGEDLALTRGVIRAYTVNNESDLKRAVRFEEEEIVIGASFTMTDTLMLKYPVTISGVDGATLSTSAPLICASDVTLKSLTIDASTPVGVGVITLAAENINVTLDNVSLTQRTEGQADTADKATIAIKYSAYNNTLVVNKSNIVLTSNKYTRGITVGKYENADLDITIKDSRITSGTDRSFPSTYSRGIAIGGIQSTKPIKIDNSTIEGFYYAINVVMPDTKAKVEVTNNSVLDGRAAFNIWSPNFVATVENSTLIGRNNYSGPSERFATIVLNKDASNNATNSDITLTDVTFRMYTKQFNNPEATNQQYAIQYRASDQKLTLNGTITVIDDQEELGAYVLANPGVTGINVIEGSNYHFNSDNAACKVFYEK